MVHITDGGRIITEHPVSRRDFLRAAALAAGGLAALKLPRARWQTDLPIPLDDLTLDLPVQALPGADIEAAMGEGLAAYFPSAQLTVCHDRQVYWHRAYGDASLTSLFDLASITKLFTTTTFLSLVGEERTGLDTPLAFAVPFFVTAGVDALGRRPVGETQDSVTWETIPVESAYADTLIMPIEVTFRHLLTHTAGLAPWHSVFEHTGPVPPPAGVAGAETRARRQEAAVRAVCGYPFAGPPGSDIRFSDLGFILLGAAVAQLHGAPLEDAIRERVTDPLDLDATTFNPLLAEIPETRIMPGGFDDRWRNRSLRGEPHDRNAAGMGGVAGHAGLFGTSYDLLRFGQAWLDAVRDGDETLLPAGVAGDATVQQATNGRVRRGFGWELRPEGYARSGTLMSAMTFGHTGYTGTSLFIDPARSLVVVCLTNWVHGSQSSDLAAFWPVLHDTIVEILDWFV
jgi:CubicO group peptidase (beta-lactamase class C family)